MTLLPRTSAIAAEFRMIVLDFHGVWLYEHPSVSDTPRWLCDSLSDALDESDTILADWRVL